MPADLIASRLKAALGADIHVTFDDDDAPRQIVVYRPDRLSEDFVALAFQALEDSDPDAVAGIEAVLVSFETRLGRSRRRVDIGQRGFDGAAGAAA